MCDKNIASYFFIILVIAIGCKKTNKGNNLPNVIISTDIGGHDPDDFQSMVHLLVYSDCLNIKGIISSPPGPGRKEHIEEVVFAYEKDYQKLQNHSEAFPEPEYLLNITKQGATEIQEKEWPSELSEGAGWIINKALENHREPLYILVWGSITDVAQAVHNTPEIKKNIRVYSIGTWNTVQDPKSRDYLYNYHPDLWWIESNSTIRGMYMGGRQEENYDNASFVETFIKDHGALGKLYWDKRKAIKMGDTPSVLYLLNGDANNPEGESWGGAFVKTGHGPNYWTDNPADSLKYKDKSGANTVNRHRQEYLDDWRKRMHWLRDSN